MRTNGKLMRASFILLVLTLITSCFVGGTFAKYISEGQGEDTARVAKWGVEVTGAGDAFAYRYNADDKASGVGVSVESNVPVVAPGTSGTFKGVTLSGTPEVAVKIDTVATIEFTGDWTADGKYYCPLIFNINGVEKRGSDYTSVEEFAQDLKNGIEGAASGVVDAGENLANSTKIPVLLRPGKITWRWEYSGDDAKDTQLGNAATGNNPPTISLKPEITVTQID